MTEVQISASVQRALAAEVAAAYDRFYEPLLSDPYPSPAFDDPEWLDICRENASAHLSFGHDIHFCLARARPARGSRHVRCADVPPSVIGLAPPFEPRFVSNVAFRGPLALDVEWDV